MAHLQHPNPETRHSLYHKPDGAGQLSTHRSWRNSSVAGARRQMYIYVPLGTYVDTREWDRPGRKGGHSTNKLPVLSRLSASTQVGLDSNRNINTKPSSRRV